MEATVQNTSICLRASTITLGKKMQIMVFLAVRLKRRNAQGKYGFAFMASHLKSFYSQIY